MGHRKTPRHAPKHVKWYRTRTCKILCAILFFVAVFVLRSEKLALATIAPRLLDALGDAFFGAGLLED